MADHSKIEWTEATWNPTVGCDIVSPGCRECYAMLDAYRKGFNPKLPRYHGLTKMTKGGPVWTGEVRTVPELLDAPMHWKKPLRIFVDSMSDLFYGDDEDRRRCEQRGTPFQPVPFEFIDKVFSTMGQCEDGGWRPHIFQILTKRAERMRDYVCTRARAAWNSGRMNHDKWPMPNVWLGVSVEDQRRADERIPLLLQTPAAVRWISAEPLLGSILLRRHIDVTRDGVVEGQVFVDHLSGLDWVVVGGESGPGARPFDIKWAQSLIAQCRAAGVPVFMKQIGALPISRQHGVGIGTFDVAWPHKDPKGGDPAEWPEDLRVREYPE